MHNPRSDSTVYPQSSACLSCTLFQTVSETNDGMEVLRYQENTMAHKEDAKKDTIIFEVYPTFFSHMMTRGRTTHFLRIHRQRASRLARVYRWDPVVTTTTTTWTYWSPSMPCACRTSSTMQRVFRATLFFEVWFLHHR